MTGDVTFAVRFFRLSTELEPYFTALYQFDFDGPDGGYIEDYLHPEWAVMRFTIGPPPVASVNGAPMARQWPFVFTGPTSKSIRFKVTRGRIWGLGLLPAGWARFVDGRACDFADMTLDGTAHPAFQRLAPILQMTQEPGQTVEETAEQINAHLVAHMGPIPRMEPQTMALHVALRDRSVSHVGALADHVGLNARAMERLCARYFGFPPKQLLRRQRFLRSLAKFMLAPEGRNWSDALDEQYYDQAQFVRDFRSFMGMTPREYADTPHPIMGRIMAQRMADAGAAPQLDQADMPAFLRYAKEEEVG